MKGSRNRRGADASAEFQSFQTFQSFKTLINGFAATGYLSEQRLDYFLNELNGLE